MSVSEEDDYGEEDSAGPDYPVAHFVLRLTSGRSTVKRSDHGQRRGTWRPHLAPHSAPELSAGRARSVHGDAPERLAARPLSAGLAARLGWPLQPTSSDADSGWPPGL